MADRATSSAEGERSTSGPWVRRPAARPVGQGSAESPSTEAAHDWAAGIRRERQLDGLLYVFLSALLAGYVLLRLDLATNAGRFGLAVAILVLVLLAARLTGGPGGHRA